MAFPGSLVKTRATNTKTATVELTRPRASANVDLQKHLEKHAPATSNDLLAGALASRVSFANTKRKVNEFFGPVQPNDHIAHRQRVKFPQSV